MSIRITANHAHVFPKDVREDGSIDVLMHIMDGCGIEKTVCFAPFSTQVPGRDQNEWLKSEIAGNDRLAGFGTIDFEAGDLAGQVKRIADLGFQGIKIHPAYQKQKLDGEKCFEVYRQAEEEDLFLSFHTGIHWHRIADYNVLLYDEVAWNFPKLRFSMEHVGGYNFYNEAVGVLLNNSRGKKRVFAYPLDREGNRFWYQPDERIRDILWLLGEDVSIFGLDFPYNGEEKIGEAIDHVLGMDISESAKEAILGGNLRREMDWK